MGPKASDPDLGGLVEFTESTGREEPEFFVGRLPEIQDIESACRRAFRRATAGRIPAGATRIVQGAPGAGKTSLLLHLCERWSADGATADFALLDLSALNSERKLAEKIIEALDRGEPAAAAGSLDAGKGTQLRRTRTTGLEGGAGMPAVASGRYRRETATAPPEADLDVVGRLFPLHEWKRPLCLMFDEAQNIARDQVRVLEPLHLGTHGLPVVAALAGLAHTREVLASHGLSHIADGGTHTLGALAEEDAAAAVEMFLDRFGVDRAGAGIDWPGELAAGSDGWPRHLHTSMQALAEGLLAADGRLADVDANAVRADVRTRRARAYWSRISPEMRRARGLAAAVMAALPEDGLERDLIMDEIKAAADPSGPSGKLLPKGMDADDFLDHLIARGALQSDGQGRLVCPIPSFREFMARGFAMAPENRPEPARRNGPGA